MLWRKAAITSLISAGLWIADYTTSGTITEAAIKT